MNQIMKRSSSISSSKLLPMMMIRNNKTANKQCKKHPKHRQSPGVCSLCLSDKLSKVSSSYSHTSRSAIIKARARAYYHSSSSSSSSPSLSSSAASSAAETPSRAAHHRRIVSDVRGSSSSRPNKEEEEEEEEVVFFSKSKSMASHRPENNQKKNNENNRKKKKKNNNNNNVIVSKIWANLLRLGKSDQKHVDAENIDSKMLMISQQQQQQRYSVLTSVT